MHKSTSVLFLLLLFGCGTDPKVNCDLDYLDGNKYIGSVNYCDAMAGKQVIFDAKANLMVLDSSFIVSIISIDSVMVGFNFADTALVECIYVEGNTSYKLRQHSNHSVDLGFVTKYGQYLTWRIYLDPCFNSTFFSGILQ